MFSHLLSGSDHVLQNPHFIVMIRKDIKILKNQSFSDVDVDVK